jgi:hypothetical protein
VGVEVGARWRPDRRNACREGLAQGFGADRIEIVEERTLHEEGIASVRERATALYDPPAVEP